MPAVHFIGELHSCTGFTPNPLSFTANRLSSLSAHWQVETKDSQNSHWRIMDGDTAGKTWLAQREAPSELAAWNSPIDMTYAFSGVDGWPQMLITVMETDVHDRQDLGGYGILRLPTSPGAHVRHVPIIRPRGTWSQSMTAFFVGGRPRYDHPFDALRTVSRYGHSTISMGVVEVRLNVTLQNMSTPEMAHVRFDTDMSQEGLDAQSVCTTCPPSATSRHRDAADDEDDEDEDRPGNSDRTALLRKDN